MITINGQKMGKSLGNFITLEEFFTGSNALLDKAYAPMTIRFFILQAHYRGTLDFSNEALLAAEKGLKRLSQAYETLQKIQPTENANSSLVEIKDNCYKALNDDLNSPMVMAQLFECARIINSANDGKESINESDKLILNEIFQVFCFDILGLSFEADNNQSEIIDNIMQLVISLRKDARTNKDFVTSDKIRNELDKIKIQLKDTRDGTEWSVVE